MAGINKAETTIKYIDSITPFCLAIKDSVRFTEALVFKGDTFYSMRKFKSALDNYLKANSLALNLSNPKLQYLSGHGIGTLKLRIGDYDDAFKIHESNLTYVENPKNFVNLNSCI